MLARLRDGGWAGADGTPSAPRALNPADGLSDPAFRAALTCAEFNQVPYLAPLRATVRQILGAAAFSYPVKVLRAVYPERPGPRARGCYVYYDDAAGGGQDMPTSWLPLMEVPPRLGGRPAAGRSPLAACAAPPARRLRSRLGHVQLPAR